MPVGELSPDGQRFVLKPLPRLVASVDDDSSVGGFFGFGKRTAKPGATAKKASFFSTSNSDDPSERNGSGSVFLKSNAPDKKTAKAADPKLKNKKKPGLFDWSAHRKEQAAAKNTTKVASKKKTDKTNTASKDCKPGKDGKLPKDCAKPGVKKADAKKKAGETKTADAKATDATAKDAKAGTAKKAPDAAAKKPDTKKVECKPGADGKLPDGCKTADAKKKPVEPVAAIN